MTPFRHSTKIRIYMTRCKVAEISLKTARFLSSKIVFFIFQVGLPNFEEFVAKAGKLHTNLK